MDPLEPTVLVIEDNLDVRELVAEALSDEGYRVISAGNGVEALALLRAGLLPRVILLDLALPVMDGYEFASLVREDEALAGIPLLICTGEPADRLGRVAANGYLPKPLNLDVVLAAVARWCPPQRPDRRRAS